VESDRKVAAGLLENAHSLEASDLDVVQSDALAYLARQGERFDVAFVDPPYASDLALASLAALPPRLNAGARVYVESADVLSPGPRWRELRHDRAGAVRYSLYELNPP
jgi:16S rRNA (guanine966-N2)-methyltransferase